jgi:UDP-N-acetylmuramate dehydrogenase
MKVVERPSLKGLNSLNVPASAALLISIDCEEDVLSLPPFNPASDLVLGAGSNVILASDVPGTVYLNRLSGREIVDQTSDHTHIEVGAGENWHALVRWSLECGLSGLENLSLIPGLAGAAPIQNIGAYGVELSSVLERVSAWDWQRSSWVSLGRSDCQLGYRDSLFKSSSPDRYLVTSIRLKLARSFVPQLGYAGLQQELTAMGVSQPSASDFSDAVCRLRRRKLPDPELAGNAGSFFKNPLVSDERAATLREHYPGLPCWPGNNDRVKLSAAWMIERCGLKGRNQGDAAVSEQHALVLINRGKATGADIIELARQVQEAVAERFGIQLEIEPKLVDFAA